MLDTHNNNLIIDLSEEEEDDLNDHFRDYWMNKLWGWNRSFIVLTSWPEEEDKHIQNSLPFFASKDLSTYMLYES
jgi:hypothetical protein